MPPLPHRSRVLRILKRLWGLLASLFALQRQVVDYAGRFIALLTPRRAGKTELACVALIASAMAHPGGKHLFLALTRPSAEDIAWGILKRLDADYALGASFHDSKLEMTLPNGAKIMLRGADQKNWIERLEGQEFKLIVIDEAGLYSIDLRKLVYGSLRPMIVKGGGRLMLIGRPGDVNQGLFWDITRPDRRPGQKGEDGNWTVVDVKGATAWAVFNWSTFENPYVGPEWRAEIDEMLRNNPKILEQPIIRRHYFGEWAEDADQNVYAYSDEKNLADRWEPMEGDKFGMATDFGWDDGQAFCIGCWNEKRPDFWVLESYKEHKMKLADALKRIEMYQQRYPGLLMWGDPARKQLYMEMATRFGTCVNVAQKEEKHDFIDLLNHDLLLGRVRIVPTGNEQLIAEIRSLKKLVKEDGTWIEHPRQPNDCCDTLLYVWRHGRHYRYKEPAKEPTPGTPDHTSLLVKQMWEAEAKKAAARQKKVGWRRA